MKKIVCVIGARPQFIKHFPLELELKKYFQIITIHTGQHYDEKMSKIFFEELHISAPAYELLLTKTSHGGQTAEMLEQIENVLVKEKPEAVVVYGDTNSTLSGALASAKMNIPVIHVEAGLRSYNKHMPEEINRILTDHMAQILFCSSEVGVVNLLQEGIKNDVYECGDLMKDALQILQNGLDNMIHEHYFFATFHRPYNTDNFSRMERILSNLNELDKIVIFPVHPRTRKILEENKLDFSAFKNIKFIEPIGYIDSLRYQKFSSCVITDSGGIQKEAYWLSRKCITVRSETEWSETLNGKWNSLVFEDLSKISKMIQVVPNEDQHDKTLYGDGKSAEKMVAVIKKLI